MPLVVSRTLYLLKVKGSKDQYFLKLDGDWGPSYMFINKENATVFQIRTCKDTLYECLDTHKENIEAIVDCEMEYEIVYLYPTITL